MKQLEPFRYPAEVEMHLPGGFTRVRLFAMAHGDVRLDIRTEAIPVPLRRLGSKVLVTEPRFSVEQDDSIAEIRRQVGLVSVEPLPEASE